MPPKRRKLSLALEVAESSIKRSLRQLQNKDDEETDMPDTTTGNSLDQVCDDMEVDTVSQTLSSPESKAKDDALKPTRISERLIIKRSRFADEEELKEKTQAVNPPRQTTPRKPRAAATGRQPKQQGKKSTKPWTTLHKKEFFLGLQQFGKNFEAISKKICQNARKNGIEPKDKIQVQYFYYRAWRKIAKWIDLKVTGVPMKTQELYGLINYGVLSLYVKDNNPSFINRLNNLIHHGKTNISRRDGRKVRIGKIRTPVCACLKKINRFIDVAAAESSQSLKFPHTVSLELTPRNSQAWAKVQSMSHNPRLRMKIPSTMTLESVIKHLTKKWKPEKIRGKEKLRAAGESKDTLVFFLHPKAKIFPVEVNAADHTEIDVSFSNYKEKVLPVIRNETKLRLTKEAEKGAAVSKSKEEAGNKLDESCILEAETGSSTEEKPPLHELSKLLLSRTNVDEPEAEKVLCGSGSLSGGGPGVLPELPTRPMTSILLDDENAMFPDSSVPFSPASSTSSATTEAPFLLPVSPPPQGRQSSSFDRPASPLVTSVKPMSPQPALTVLSPLGRKKPGRVSKKTCAADGRLTPSAVPLNPVADSSTPCGPGITNNSSSLSSSPAKQQDEPGPLGTQKHAKYHEEVAKLSKIAQEDGLTTSNSSAVTLLQLSLLLGADTHIPLQYEWRERRTTKMSVPGIMGIQGASSTISGVSTLLGQAANQMSNLLRRLCNLATLELTDFSREGENKKFSSGNVPCSSCGSATAAAKSSTSRSSRASVSSSHGDTDGVNNCITKDAGMQTEPTTALAVPAQVPLAFPGLPPGQNTGIHGVQVLQQASVVTAGVKTFVAGAPSHIGAQVNGGDPLFRVPLIPAFKDPVVRAEQQRLEEQRRQHESETAKSILEQGPTQCRLLKKRRVLTKKKKAPPVIVQRTLMPKLDHGENIVTYIQQPVMDGNKAVVLNLAPAESLIAVTRMEPTATPPPPPLQTVTTTAPTTTTSLGQTPYTIEVKGTSAGVKPNDLLKQAALSAEITMSDEASNLVDPNVMLVEEESDETKSFGPKPLSEEVPITPISNTTCISVSPTTSYAINSISSGSQEMLPMFDSDSKLLDFDISMSAIHGSNSNSGDKFLDFVFRTEQGFSGLLSTPKKVDRNGTSALPGNSCATSPNLSVIHETSELRTPTHSGSCVPVGHITPIKLDLEQEWGHPLAVGDISLSSVLGDSSSFKTTEDDKSLDKYPPGLSTASRRPTLYADVSNDGFSKSNEVISFSSLLGDPSFRKDDDSTSGLSPPLSSSSSLMPAALTLVPASPTPSPTLSLSIAGSGGVALTSPVITSEKARHPEGGQGSVPPFFPDVSQDSFTARLDMEPSLQASMVGDNSLDLSNLVTGSRPETTTMDGDAAAMPDLNLAMCHKEGSSDSLTTKLHNPTAS